MYITYTPQGTCEMCRGRPHVIRFIARKLYDVSCMCEQDPALLVELAQRGVSRTEGANVHLSSNHPRFVTISDTL